MQSLESAHLISNFGLRAWVTHPLRGDFRVPWLARTNIVWCPKLKHEMYPSAILRSGRSAWKGLSRPSTHTVRDTEQHAGPFFVAFPNIREALANNTPIKTDARSCTILPNFVGYVCDSSLYPSKSCLSWCTSFDNRLVCHAGSAFSYTTGRTTSQSQ